MKCRGCDQEIEFFGNIPVEVPAQRCVLDWGPNKGKSVSAYVNHFTTCPKAADFSKRNKARAGSGTGERTP